jgi:hypothetical protein
MTDQTDTSAHGTSAQPSLQLIYVLAPLYWRLLTAGVAQLCIEYDGKEGIGEVSCEARNAFGQAVTSQLSDELTKHVVAFVLILVERRYPDWARGAGGSGSIDWNLSRNDLIHTHSARTVTVTTTEHRGL